MMLEFKYYFNYKKTMYNNVKLNAPKYVFYKDAQRVKNRLKVT